MALTFFSDNRKQSGNSVFYTEWLEENPKVKTLEFLVNEFKLVQSGKGYLAVTEDFTYFIWKNSKETKLLVEALKVYVKEPNKGHPIYLVRKKVTDERLSLAADLDTEITWFEGKGVYTTSEESSSSEKTMENPFLG
jgi:hypothetical protein